jgi:hypothetical protein
MELINKILDNKLRGVTRREIITCSDILQKIFFKNITIAILSSIGSRADKGIVATYSALLKEVETLFIITSPKVRISIGSLEILALIDSSAEVDLISSRVAERTGLDIRPDPQYGIVGYSSERKKFDRICENIAIRIGSIGITINFFIIDSPQNDIVLGQPFIIASLLFFSYRDGF